MSSRYDADNDTATSLSLKETLLGVLRNKDIKANGVIHTSDFKAAISSIGLTLASKEVSDILLQCKVGANGEINYSRVAEELKIERQIYNSKIPQDVKKHLKTSSGAIDTPWRADAAHQEKVQSEKQSRLVYALRDEIHDIYRRATHGDLDINGIISSLQRKDVQITKAFKELVRRNDAAGMMLPDISFAEFKRALTTVDSMASPQYKNQNTINAHTTSTGEIPLFQCRKRIDQSARDSFQFTSSESAGNNKPSRSLLMDVNEIGEERRRFHSSNAVKEIICSDKCPSSIMSHSQMSMHTGAVGQEVVIRYTSEQKFLREQMLSTMRLLDSNKITLVDFIDNVYKLGLTVPDELMNEVKRTNATGNIDWNKCVRLLDANLFTAVALESKDAFDRKLERLKNKLIDALRSKNTEAISEMVRCFESMDKDGDKVLSLSEFKQGCRAYGLITTNSDSDSDSLTEDDIRDLYNYLDANGDACLTLNEFLDGIRGELNATRKRFIRYAYTKLDRSGDERVQLQGLIDSFDPSFHPDVVAGKRTVRQAVTAMIVAFDDRSSKREPVIDYKKFECYYANISPFIHSDEAFVAMMKGCWKLGDKAPPPQLQRSENGTFQSQALQTHGDIICWEQEPSQLERDNVFKGKLHNNQPLTSSIDLAYVKSHGKNTRKDPMEMEQIYRDEMRSQSDSQKRRGFNNQYLNGFTDGSAITEWDTSAKANRSANKKEFVASSLAKVIAMNTKSSGSTGTACTDTNKNAPKSLGSLIDLSAPGGSQSKQVRVEDRHSGGTQSLSDYMKSATAM